MVEQYVLNPRTGDIEDFKARREAPASRNNASNAMPKIAPIDLDALRQSRAGTTGAAGSP